MKPLYKIFTLIEMLVVISIICILAAMMMPSLLSALSSARTLSCANNIKQVGDGFGCYASATEGWIPPVYYASGTSAPNWADEICRVGMGLNGYPSSYMIAANEVLAAKDLGVWNCSESERTSAVRCGWAQGNVERGTCYTINGWNNVSEIPEGRASGIRVGAIKNPSQLYQLLESTYFRSEAWYDTGKNVIPSTLIGLGIDRVRYPHNSSMNILYVDNHVSLSSYPLPPQGTTGSASYYNWHHK